MNNLNNVIFPAQNETKSSYTRSSDKINKNFKYIPIDRYIRGDILNEFQ
jgi:hypothetical protein